MTEPAWRTLHRDAIVADAHNDLLCAVVARPVPQWGTFFRTQWLPQLREGGVDLQVLPVFIDDAFRPEGALRQIDAALASARIAAILALESAPGVGEDVELLQTLHRLGCGSRHSPTSAAVHWPTAAPRMRRAAGSPRPGLRLWSSCSSSA